MQDVSDMTQEEKDALKEVLYDLLKTSSYSLGYDIDFKTPNANRDFYIEYTCLKWDEYEHEWLLTCLIQHPGEELIYDPELKYSKNTNIKLKSWKNNWYKCFFYSSRDIVTGEIPLYKLYSDFQERNYEGRCWMR
jgi:hypothetical protein